MMIRVDDAEVRISLVRDQSLGGCLFTLLFLPLILLATICRWRVFLWRRSNQRPTQRGLSYHLRPILVGVVLFLPHSLHAISSNQEDCFPVILFLWEMLGEFTKSGSLLHYFLRGNLIPRIRDLILHDFFRQGNFFLSVQGRDD